MDAIDLRNRKMIGEAIAKPHVSLVGSAPRTAAELRGLLAVSHRKFFRDNYVNPAILNGYIVSEEGVSLHNPHLRYFITQKGRDVLKRHERV